MHLEQRNAQGNGWGERLARRGGRLPAVGAGVTATDAPRERVPGVRGERLTRERPTARDAVIELMAPGGMASEARGSEARASGPRLPADRVGFYGPLISGSVPVRRWFLGGCGGQAAGCAARYLKPDSAWLTGAPVVPPP